MKSVILYTDGACFHNPGPGGYGVVLLFNGHRKELSGGYRRTTNNRMELTAVIVGLETLKEPCRVQLFTDSEYITNAINLGWVGRWERTGWKKAKNPDLWKKLLVLLKKHQVVFNWVKGHAGNPENERCDQLALQASHSQTLAMDEFYEKLPA
jgi:ribonuclease HI